MKRFVAVVCLVLVAGCHDAYSNENILFLKALPRGLGVDVPGASTQSQRGLRPAQFEDGQARFYAETLQQAREVNGHITNIFAIVDHVVDNAPPTIENDDMRIWGPFPVDESNEAALVINRMRTSTVATFVARGRPVETDEWYTYSLIVRPVGTSDMDWKPAIAGVSVPIPDTPYGTGMTFLDLSVADGDGKTGILAIPYDSRFGENALDLYFDADRATMKFEPEAAWQYRRDVDGNIEFLFYVVQNLEGTGPAPELLAISTRWRADHYGRADVVVTQGDLGAMFFYASECWDPGFIRTYFASNIPDYQPEVVGTPLDCAEGLRMSTFPN